MAAFSQKDSSITVEQAVKQNIKHDADKHLLFNAESVN
jgi:hypothetical protein